MLKNEDVLNGLDADIHAELVVGGERHVRTPFCLICKPGFPAACKCGGLAHAGESETLCDRCGGSVEVMESMTLDGEPHMPGQPACPACSPHRPQPCQCGGWIHISPQSHGEPAEVRRCDRCGVNYQDYDI